MKKNVYFDALFLCNLVLITHNAHPLMRPGAISPGGRKRIRQKFARRAVPLSLSMSNETAINPRGKDVRVKSLGPFFLAVFFASRSTDWAKEGLTVPDISINWICCTGLLQLRCKKHGCELDHLARGYKAKDSYANCAKMISTRLVRNCCE